MPDDREMHRVLVGRWQECAEHLALDVCIPAMIVVSGEQWDVDTDAGMAEAKGFFDRYVKELLVVANRANEHKKGTTVNYAEVGLAGIEAMISYVQEKVRSSLAQFRARSTDAD